MSTSAPIHRRLVEDIPELKDKYDEEIASWEGEEPGAHNIFGDILNPFLLDELATMQDRPLLGRIFRFLEMMAQSDDLYVREVLTDTVLEQLGDDPEILQKARGLMGPKTLVLSHEVEKMLGRE